MNITKICPCSKGDRQFIRKLHATQISSAQDSLAESLSSSHILCYGFPFIIGNSHIAFAGSTVLQDVSHVTNSQEEFVFRTQYQGNPFLFLKNY